MKNENPQTDSIEINQKINISQLDIVAIELRRAREEKKLSYTDLNRITGISRSVLLGYETGRTKPGAKEIKLLCLALQINPNRLIFGEDEPFKPRSGLSAILKLRNSSLSIMVASILVPVVFASLSEDQLESILILLSGLIEVRDKDAAKKINAFAEVMGEIIGDGSPEAITDLTEKMKDPEFMEMLNKKMESKIDSE